MTTTQTATPGRTPSTAPDAQSRTCTIFLRKVLLVQRDLFVLHAIVNCWSSLVDTASVVRHAAADDTAVTPGGYANQDYGTRTLTFSNHSVVTRQIRRFLVDRRAVVNYHRNVKPRQHRKQATGILHKPWGTNNVNPAGTEIRVLLAKRELKLGALATPGNFANCKKR